MDPLGVGARVNEEVKHLLQVLHQLRQRRFRQDLTGVENGTHQCWVAHRVQSVDVSARLEEPSEDVDRPTEPPWRVSER